jgi:hypothetical protein
MPEDKFQTKINENERGEQLVCSNNPRINEENIIF